MPVDVTCPYCGGKAQVSGTVDDMELTFQCSCFGGSEEAALATIIATVPRQSSFPMEVCYGPPIALTLAADTSMASSAVPMIPARPGASWPRSGAKARL